MFLNPTTVVGLVNEHAWKVSIDEIKTRNYNLDFKNPNKKETDTRRSPEEILKKIEQK